MRELINRLNNSKLLLGLFIILMNVGSRYVVQDMPKAVNRLLMHPITRLIVTFGIVYVSTRDIEISLFLTLLFVLFTKYLLHEESAYCILPKHIIELDKDNDRRVSLEELERAQKVLDAYKKALTQPKESF